MKVLIHFNPQFGQCPECKKMGTLNKSRARTMREQIIKRTTIFKLYRCKECGWRGFRSTLILTKKSARNIFVYAALVLITAYIARLVITKLAL